MESLRSLRLRVGTCNIISKRNMEIECPSDYDYAISENRVFCDSETFRAPQLNLQKRKRKRARQQGARESSKVRLPDRKEGQKENYFQRMYREANKKMYVNLFVRKIKHRLVGRQKPKHQLLEDSEDPDLNSIRTFKWNFYAEVIYTLFLICECVAACIITSLGLAFPEINDQTFSIAITGIAVLTGVIEIIFNFTSRSSLDIQCLKTKKIYIGQVAWKYIRKGFAIDALIVLIFLLDLMMTSSMLSYFKLLIVLKLGPTIQKIRNLQILFIQNCFKEQYWELIKVFLANFLFAHFLAIILILMTTDARESWLTARGLDDQAWLVRYVWSYYWGTTIMLTIGFGDLTPTNTTEVIVVIFIETFSCIFLAYNINCVGTIIRKITSYQQEKMSNLKIFTEMQGKEDVSQDIKNKIRNFVIESSELKRKYNVEQEEAFLSHLPHTFYEQFKQESTVKIFQGIPFFRNLPLAKLREISMKIEKRLTHPQEILIPYNTVPDIYIANNGKIMLTMHQIDCKNHGKIIQQFKIKKDEYKILSLYFFNNQTLNYDVMCKDYTIIYSLKKEVLEKILSTNPYCYEMYCMKRDKDKFNPNELETEQCALCNDRKAHHTFFSCPKMHYIPIKNVIVAQALKNKPQRIKNILKPVSQKRPEKVAFSSLKLYSELDGGFYQKQIFQLANTMFKQIISDVQSKRSSLQVKESRHSQRKGNLRKLSFSAICQKMGQKIKQEVIKQNFSPTHSEFKWEIEVDIAHDYPFYFSKNNPSNVCELSKKKQTTMQLDSKNNTKQIKQMRRRCSLAPIFNTH